jgi:ParB-like chromosome segregation protein Spo0J
MSAVVHELSVTKIATLCSVTATIEDLPTDKVVTGPSLRAGGINPDHVRTLAELEGQWPPILVRRADGLVIDGQHRVEAARLLGLSVLRATFYEGPPEGAFLEFVRRNVEHGLPLTLAERRGAAIRILRSDRNWSNRRIGRVCGLSPHTVESLRSIGGPPEGDRRIGSDGRSRPSDPARLRREIEELLVVQPGRSLRAIADAVGASPETVRRVRRRLDAGTQAASAELPLAQAEMVPRSPTARVVVGVRHAAQMWWKKDTALTSTGSGQRLVQWLSESDIYDDGWKPYVADVPLSRVYDVAAEARRRAQLWVAYAEAVEARAH